MSGQVPRESAWSTLVRGLRLSPEFRAGLVLTLALALVATAGRVVVPITVQQLVDRALRGGAGQVDFSLVARLILLALATVAVTALAGYAMGTRLALATESALSALRVRTFRHIHDLSLLHHTAEHRGALVSRVTADIDAISQFMQRGGAALIVSVAQLLLAATVMAVYSWRLTLVVLAVLAPLWAVLRWFQRRLSAAYDRVRQRVGDMLSAISESVVGAPVIRAYAIEERTNRRIRRAVRSAFDADYGAAKVGALMFSCGELFAAAASAAAVVVGVLLGVGGQISEGRLVAFLFLVMLFVGPVQLVTEVLDQAQAAIAGWRRVLGVLDSAPDVADPEGGARIPPGPIAIRFEHVGFAYPSRAGEEPATVLADIDLEIPAQRRVAIVGETGSGKTTLAKLLTRLMDPISGRVLISGVPLADVRFDSLRQRVVMVPQDGFLFNATIFDNVARGRPGIDAGGVRLAFLELGLADWLDALSLGLDTPVGERGESLSVGERQLVALARAYVANPDLLVLDEATSAVDPATEVALQRALEGATRGRTAVAIAHRLSTAEAADEVLVLDHGRLVQRGPHSQLITQPGVYATLYASWIAGGLDAHDPSTSMC
ncbi:MAG: ABC transporter ATP-binding protein [Egibacteraceae bacterium]